jgi:outer membrane protein TolC
VNSSTATGSAPAVQQAQEQLVSARAELAAANQALGAILGQGDETKIAIARGRVAGAEYAVSSAEMNVTAAQAGISDTETAAASP